MAAHHDLLSRQLKKVGIESIEQAPTKEQWLQLLERVVRVYTEVDQERYLLERSQEISSLEIQELYSHVEEAQHIAGLGNWSFDLVNRRGYWSKECSIIFSVDDFVSPPNYRKIFQQIHKRDLPNVSSKIDAALKKGKKFEIEFRIVSPDNKLRWLHALGHPVTDSNGEVRKLSGTVMDVTRRKRVELRLAMEHTVISLLSKNVPTAQTMSKIIRTVCEALDWACGVLWTFDKSGALREQAGTWHVADSRLKEFLQTSKHLISSSNQAAVLGGGTDGEVHWIPDASQDKNFLRSHAAAQAGLRAAFSLPIYADGAVTGVMEFFAAHVQRADHEMLQSASFIGRHIGDFFQRKHAENALRESEEHFRSVVEQASDSLYMHDIEGKLIDVNQLGCDCLGYTRQELLTMVMADIDVDLSVEELHALNEKILSVGAIAFESYHRRKDGTVFPVEVRIGQIIISRQRHLLSLVRDITERKQLQAHVQRLAYHDSLTGLPNRAMFKDRLHQAISKAKRFQKMAAIMFIDLDRFKAINDMLGHNAGDQLLQEVARRITTALRTTDVIARLGGDEFVVLIEEVTESANVGRVAQKILAAVLKEYVIADHLIHVTASIGISIFPNDAEDEPGLVKNADIAMYRAKEKGKNNFQFYSSQMDVSASGRLALESDLRHALERNELLLHYQAKVESKTGRIVGVEALIRWQHPDLGLVSPARFIPIAEETGLIVPISKWVLEEVCRQSLSWREQGLPALRIAINISPRQFFDDNLLDDTADTLRQLRMDPSLLEFEITESMMMRNIDKAIQLLTEFKAMGISIAIDDFGVAYSSLSQLKRFPIDVIKIDQSFIRGIPNDRADAAITEAIISMAKNLNIKLVAEGVETNEQLQFLREHHCDEIQGYIFSKPIPSEEFSVLMRNQSGGHVHDRRVCLQHTLTPVARCA